MAVGIGVVAVGESGVPQSNSPLNPSGGSPRQDPGAESGVPQSSSPANLSGGGSQVPQSNNPLNPNGGSQVPQSNNPLNPNEGSQVPQSVVVVKPENFPHEEILNVLWIEDSREHRAALKEWDRKESYLSSKVDRKEKRSADLTNQIFNIVGFFSVFQGVVLTAVSQLKSYSQPQCGMVWVPALLSSVAAFVAIVGVGIKFSTLQELETSIRNEKIAQTVRKQTFRTIQGMDYVGSLGYISVVALGIP